MLTMEQFDQLMKPLHPSRVAKRSGGGGKQLSYLEAWDVRAHLIRMFNFGGWSFDVISADLAYAFGPNDGGSKNHDVGYKVVGRLTIHGIGHDGGDVTYTEAAVGPASLPNVGEAHDMAIKTAESDCLKRCAMNLGTQFGLSLYDDGRVTDVVKGVVGVGPIGPKTDSQTANDIVNGRGVAS